MKIWQKFLYTAVVIAVSACGKKGKDSDSGDAEEAELVGAINVKCGEGNCFGGESSSLRLQGESQLQTLQMFSWIIVGFPSTEEYENAITSEEQQAVVKEDGLVGAIEAIRQDVVAGAQKEGITSCADAPTSGKFELDDATVTWTKATMSSPESFPTEGKKYDKAIDYEGKDGKLVHFEFLCDYNGMVAVMTNEDDGDVASKSAFYYDRDDSDKLYADFYLVDTAGIISANGLELVLMLRSLTPGVVDAWVTRTGANENGNGSLGYRYAMSADLDEEKISFYQVEVGTGDTQVTQAQWDASAYVTSVSVTGGGVPSVGNGNDPKNGCASSWDQTSTDISSADTCSGLDLSEAPALSIDADGDASLGWIRENLSALILDL